MDMWIIVSEKSRSIYGGECLFNRPKGLLWNGNGMDFLNILLLSFLKRKVTSLIGSIIINILSSKFNNNNFESWFNGSF